MIAPHPMAQYWTPDEIAEALGGISLALTARLWELMDKMPEHKPLGGDGSNGTVEWPEPTQKRHSVEAVWEYLTESEREAINLALTRDA